jgi:hypothetical protein
MNINQTTNAKDHFIPENIPSKKKGKTSGKEVFKVES